MTGSTTHTISPLHIHGTAHLDPPSTVLNATDTFWHFFAAHLRP